MSRVLTPPPPVDDFFCCRALIRVYRSVRQRLTVTKIANRPISARHIGSPIRECQPRPDSPSTLFAGSGPLFFMMSIWGPGPLASRITSASISTDGGTLPLNGAITVNSFRGYIMRNRLSDLYSIRDHFRLIIYSEIIRSGAAIGGGGDGEIGRLIGTRGPDLYIHHLPRHCS
ncbi:hypothetical protein J6590_023614 [Homalodisca vitripennis]|nr:hypothetical protein J6590_023614 [Homalodisca vitripennis]